MNKNLAYFLLAFLVPASLHAGEWIGIHSAKPAAVKVKLVSTGENETVLSMQLPGFTQSNVITPDGNEIKIQVPGATPMLQAGSPDLPKVSTNILIPDHAKMKVEVLSSSFRDYANIKIAPGKGSVYRNIDPNSIPFKYGEPYDQNAFFPGALTELQMPFIVRDFRGQSVWFYPFQYNPVTKMLRVYTEMTVKISEESQNGENILNRNAAPASLDKEFSYIYSSLFINGNKAVRYVPLTEDGEMLIISGTAWMNAMQPFMQWKTRRGIHCELVDVSTIGNNDVSIKNFILNYYNSHPLKYVLLVGDVGDVATPSMSGGASDPSYGYLAGTDSYAEVMVGRFSAQSLADVETQVQRSIEYELNPTAGGTWYKKAVGIASDLGPGDDGEMDWEHERNIRTNLLNYGYSDVDELYDGTHGIVDASGDPGTNDLVTLINDGRSVINYTGHGSQNACATTGFSSSDVPSLTNAGMLPFWWSVGCVHGEFDNGTCIAEVLLRAQNGGQPTGMVATFMSSINQYWDEPMDAQDEFDSVLTECYANNIKRTYGGISINGCMHMNTKYGVTGDDMTNTWHCFGDPSLVIRNNTPSDITATHPTHVPVGTSQLIVSCNTNGALITVTKGLNILGSGIVAGNTATINFPSFLTVDTFVVTATAFNCRPYSSDVFVFTASGPYVIYAASTIHDLAGNNDGFPDFSEAIQLDVELYNIGLTDASGVTAVLSTADTFITITTGSAAYGTIAVGNTINFSNAFAYTISDSIPDQHAVHFDLIISDGVGNTWTGSLLQTINAPAINIFSFSVNDAAGNNNGFLDPGETADIIITTTNEGHSASPSTNGTLLSANPYVTINTATSSMGSINPGGSFASTLNVTLAPNIALGSAFDLTFNVSAFAYSTSKQFTLSAGEILEDFETNNFLKFPWYSGGSAAWTTTTTNPFQGLYCAQSGSIGNNSTSELNMDVVVLANDSVSFYKTVSSESGYDFLRFYIDGVAREQWSGNVGWSYSSYYITTGNHTLKWVYEKDAFMIDGADACWVDNIQLPPMVLPTGVKEINSAASLLVYPNPVTDVANLNIVLDHPSEVLISLYDMKGSLVQKISGGMLLSQGSQLVRFSTARIPKGIYALQVIVDGKVSVVRLVK